MSADPAQVEQILTGALHRANHIERHVYLTAACNGDSTLWNEVWDRLRNTECASGRTRGVKRYTAPLQSPGATEHPGTIVGPYELKQIIGEGALSMVWRAERSQRLQEFVAVKVLNVDAEGFLKRFEARKHALALMDHPGICPSQACGTSPGGRPCLVSPLQHGVPITQFCDDQKLPLPMRTRLFIQACEIIHHAHQRGVVHGGIKPANLLVSWGEDAQPVLHITDFGVAAALNHACAASDSGRWRAPPAYFAPEHTVGGTIDARTDVHALGTLLHELVTGRLPFDVPEGAEGEEVLRLIRETRPPKPSACVAALPRAQINGIALSRQTEAAPLIAKLEEYFDWVVMRALEPDPAERPSTASALAGELQRFVIAAEAEEKLRAVGEENRPGSVLREHRGLFVTAVVLVMLIAGVLGVAGWLLYQERVQTKAVEKKRQEDATAMTADFLHHMLTGLSPEAVKQHDTALLNHMLHEAEDRLGAYAEHPAAAAKMQETIGLTYLALSQPADAEKQLEGALEKRRLALGSDHAETLLTMKNLAVALKDQGRSTEAEVLLRHTLTTQQRVLGAEHHDTFVTITVLAAVCDDQEKRVEAENLYLHLWQVQKRLLGPDHLETLGTMGRLASSYQNQGRFTEAAKLCQERLEGCTRAFGPRDPRTVVSMTIAAEAFEADGQPTEAEKLFFGALEIMKQTLGTDHPDTLAQLDKLALFQSRHGRRSQALALHQRSLDVKRRTLGELHPQTILSMQFLAEENEAAGRRKEAEEAHLQVLDTLRNARGPGHPDTLAEMDSLAAVYGHHGRAVEARKLEEQVLEARQHTLGEQHPQTLRTMRRLAEAYEAEGRHTEAERLHLQTLDAMKTAFGPGDPDTLTQMNTVAHMHLRHDEPQRAAEMFEKILEIQQHALESGHADTLETLHNLAQTYQRLGRSQDAEAICQQALQTLRQQANADPHAMAAVAASLGALHLENKHFAEAEIDLRFCLDLRVKHDAEHWLRFATESLLGEALLEQQRLEEAGPLLRNGYDGLLSRVGTLPADSRDEVRSALARLARFSEAAQNTEETAKWKRKLAEYDQSGRIAG
ncbi:MAG: tetratricopeptide repeat protein [Verrucomicrobiaceae bacterium]